MKRRSTDTSEAPARERRRLGRSLPVLAGAAIAAIGLTVGSLTAASAAAGHGGSGSIEQQAAKVKAEDAFTPKNGNAEMNVTVLDPDLVKPNATEKDPWAADWAKRNAAGSGPYTLTTNTPGVEVVLEHVGEATWQTSLQSARAGGRIVVCGATSGPNPPAALHRIWWKQLTIFGSTMGTRSDFEAVYDLVVSGRAKPTVDMTFPLSEARAAHERLEAGEQLGKIVLTIPG